MSTIQTRFLGVMRTSSNVADPAVKKRFLVAGACSCALMRASWTSWQQQS